LALVLRARWRPPGVSRNRAVAWRTSDELVRVRAPTHPPPARARALPPPYKLTVCRAYLTPALPSRVRGLSGAEELVLAQVSDGLDVNAARRASASPPLTPRNTLTEALRLSLSDVSSHSRSKNCPRSALTATAASLIISAVHVEVTAEHFSAGGPWRSL
jgi:hypothetical protein